MDSVQTTAPFIIKNEIWSALEAVTKPINGTAPTTGPPAAGNDDRNGSSSLTRIATLCVLWTFIVFGNVLVISVSRHNYRRQVPEFLILSLAIADLVNGMIPVSISIGLYLFTDKGFNHLKGAELCLFYNSTATAARISSCFIATVMAIDRAISVYRPLYYRTKLGLTKMRRAVLLFVALAILLACVPLTGVPKVYPFDVVCSFDFGSSYAVLIMLLGYVQLLIVAVCYILVIKGLVGFIERQASIRRQQQRPSMIDEEDIIKYLAMGRRKSSAVDIMRDIGIFKTSKKFAKIMGTVVFLFYLSWLPIVVSITLRLATGRYSETLQFISARMSLVSSTANPLVYGIMSRTYRRGYLYTIRLLLAVFGCPKPNSPFHDSKVKKRDGILASRPVKKQQKGANQLLINPITPAVIITDASNDIPPEDVSMQCQRSEITLSVDITTERNHGGSKEKRDGCTSAVKGSTKKLELQQIQLSLGLGIDNAGITLDPMFLSDHEPETRIKTRLVKQLRTQSHRGSDGDSESSDRLPNKLTTVNNQNEFEKNVRKSRSVPDITTGRKRVKKRTKSEEVKRYLDEKTKTQESFLAKLQKQRTLSFLSLNEKSSSDEEDKTEAVRSSRHRMKKLTTKSEILGSDSYQDRQGRQERLSDHVDDHESDTYENVNMTTSEEEPTFL